MGKYSRSSSSSDSDSEKEHEQRSRKKYRKSPPEKKKTAPKPANVFKNDGSFMEMFKKMQNEQKDKPADSSTTNETKSDNLNAQPSASGESSGISNSKKPALFGLVGKRRGGRVLPTGVVKKPRKDGQPQEEQNKNDAWSRYLNEVRKYREQSCEEEGKRRPLVK